jgi:hypothetical protein
MSADSRFKPPVAEVADIDPSTSTSSARAIALVGGMALFDVFGWRAALSFAFFPFYPGALVSVAGVVLVRSKGKPA